MAESMVDANPRDMPTPLRSNQPKVRNFGRLAHSFGVRAFVDFVDTR
jgi:hypothetical protein